MNKNRFSLTVYVAPAFAVESGVGHMWISLDEYLKGFPEHTFGD